MQHQLPKLPYALDALEPHISKETLEFHYGKHHKTYVEKLNDLVVGTPFENSTLEHIIKNATGPIFNNGAQIWNHTFYWHCLSPNGGTLQPGKLHDKITQKFGSVEAFQTKFTEAAIATFGAGWAWLVQDGQGELSIVSTSNAANPMQDDLKPLLTCDVWEHAYYIDYRNARPAYLKSFWSIVNYAFAESQLNG